LQLLASSCSQAKDAACNGKAMEMLVAYYPKREYWLSVIYGIATRPGFSERLALDLARLKIETGTMRGAEEYLDAAQLSLQEGFPMEAVRIIDKGYASGVLGTGGEAARHKRLKDMAAKNLADDKKALAREESQPGAAKDGRALFNEGFNYVLLGKPEQGLALMEKGIRDAKAFRRLDHAKLQLGYAHHLAGQNQKAIQILKTVQGTDGAAALARLWAVRLSRAS
jgi:tetratricopeptide (TPR) repeat protein